MQRDTAKDVDHNITNIVRSGIKRTSGITKPDTSDHFPNIFGLNTCEKNQPEDKAQFVCKFIYGEDQNELFEHELSHIEWNSIIKTLDNQNTA